jgi:hypothetical protein
MSGVEGGSLLGDSTLVIECPNKADIDDGGDKFSSERMFEWMLRGVVNPELVNLGDKWEFSSSGSSGNSLYEAGADRGRFGLELPLEFPEDGPGERGE